MPINILFTSVGRRVELLGLFRKAYSSLQLSGAMVAMDADPLAPALRAADRCYIVPRLSDPDYLPSLLKICRQEKVDLVFPLIDPDIPVLARHRTEIEATGARVATVDQEGAALAADKWETFKFFRRLDLPTPMSYLPESVDLNSVQYPVFIKPRHGSASKNAFAARDARELDFFLGYIEKPIVQEFVQGHEITNDVICDVAGNVIAVVSRQRIEVRWGEVSKGVTVYHPEITAACVRIARALQASGPITIQCIMRQGSPVFTEINARLGGGAPLGVHAGVDWPQWLLARAAGVAVEPSPLGTYKTGLFLTRFDDSYFLTEAERDTSCHF